MGYLNTLSNFFELLCEKASNNEMPEVVLARDNISELFLSLLIKLMMKMEEANIIENGMRKKLKKTYIWV